MPAVSQLEAILKQADLLLQKSEDRVVRKIETSLRARLRELEARLRRLQVQELTGITDTSKREARARMLVTQLESALGAFALGDPATGVTDALRAEIIESQRIGIETASKLLGKFDEALDLRSSVDLDAVRAATENTRARLSRYDDEFAQTAEDLVIRSLVDGSGPRKAAAGLRDLTGQELWKAERISRTETIRSQDEASRATYKRNSVDLVQVTATLDDRVCFPAGTLVRTEIGDRPIETIQVGDLVLTRQGLRRVVDTMNRSHQGRMLLVIAGDLRAVSTADHPYWTSAGWKQAQHLWIGDELQTFEDERIKVDSIADVTFAYAQHAPAEPFELLGFSSVLGDGPGLGMPVVSVNFDGDQCRRQGEVNRVTGDRELLLKVQTKAGQAFADSSLKAGFAPETPVAAEATEARWVGGLAAEALAAMQAGVDGSRAAAFLGTEASSLRALAGEPLAASLTVKIDRLFGGTSTTASSVAIGNASRDSEILAANHTSLGDGVALDGFIADARAELTSAFDGASEGCVADLASSGLAFLASDPHTSARTELASVFGSLSGRMNPKNRLADLADFGNETSWNQTSHESESIRVFDLTVEDEHEFFVNGILVHNCGYCASRHMNVYKIEDCPIPQHPGCRDSALPFRQEWLDEGLISLEDIQNSKATILARTKDQLRTGPSPAEKFDGKPAAVPVWKVPAGGTATPQTDKERERDAKRAERREASRDEDRARRIRLGQDVGPEPKPKAGARQQPAAPKVRGLTPSGVSRELPALDTFWEPTAQLEKQAARFREELTLDERLSFKGYSSTAYREINYALRGHAPITEVIAQDAANISGAIQKFGKLDAPISAYRGMRFGSETERAAFLAKLDVDGVFENAGFFSTSLDADRAKRFVNEAAPFLFRIKADKGAFMDSALSNHDEELEFLIDHASKFRIIGATNMHGFSADLRIEYIVVELEQIQ